MAVPISPRRTRPRFGPAGLVAAAHGLAFTGLMLAGLDCWWRPWVRWGLPCSVSGPSSRAPEVSGEPKVLLALLAIGTGLLAGRFRSRPRCSASAAGQPDQAPGREWCGVPIAEPRPLPPPPHQGRLTFTERLRWLLSDPATQRDLRWTALNLVVWILAGVRRDHRDRADRVHRARVDPGDPAAGLSG